MATPREMMSRIIDLWESYSREYRTNPIEYEFLKEERRRLKLPLKPIPERIMDEYPEIEVLRIFDRGKAVTYLMVLPAERLHEVLLMIESLPYNYAFNTLRAYLIDSRWLICHHGERYYYCGTKPGKARKVYSGYSSYGSE